MAGLQQAGRRDSEQIMNLKTEISAQALIRRARGAGAAAYVMRKGDPDAGLIYVKVARLDGRADLYTPTRDLDGNRAYRRALGEDPKPEAEADAMIARETEFDPDLWVIEVEDREGRPFIVEAIL